MSQNNTLSAKAQNIVDNFINENWGQENSISKTDVMKHVIITIYAQMPNAKDELIQPFKEFIFNLNDYFTQEEINIILKESKAVIMYCYKYADVMQHYSFNDDSELMEEVLVEDSPYSIYKTPKSIIDLCMRLSGKPKANEKVFIPYGDVADYALYNPEAKYKLECEGYPTNDDKIIQLNNVSDYYKILLDSQSVESETIYDDCSYKSTSANILPDTDYVFAYNPTLNKSQYYPLRICDGMWYSPQNVTSSDLALSIISCLINIKPDKCIDFVLPIEYLENKNFWNVLKVIFKTEKVKSSTTIITLPSMEWGDTYVVTFLLHIKKSKENSGIIRFIDATSSDFKLKRGFTEEGKSALFNHSNGGITFSVTNPAHYNQSALNVDFLMEIIDSEECNTKYKESITYAHFVDRNKSIPHQYIINKKLPELSAEEKYISVGELADVITPVKSNVLLSDTSFNWKESVLGPIRGTYIQGERLSNDYLNSNMNVKNDVTLGFCQFKNFVKTPCLLVGINDKGTLTVGKIKIKDKYIVVDEDVIALKLKSDAITEDYLLRELTMSYCTKQVSMLSDTEGTDTKKVFDTKNVIDIKIAVPSLEEQERRCNEDVRKSLEEARKYLKEADRQLIQSAEEFKRDVHMKKHAIGQTLFNLSNWWDLLQKARKDGNGIVDDSKEIGKIHKTPIGDIYTNIQMSIEKLQMQVEHFWQADGLQTESISLQSFIKEYIKEHQSPLFTYQYDKVSMIDYNKFPEVTFSKQALTKVFDSIINNACSHGFENESSDRNIVKIELLINDGLPYITISNNGKPIHEKISTEDVFTYGRSSKSGQNHYGIGGYEIRNLMREFKGEAEFISTPQAEFPVSYKLTFKSFKI